jgi:hypothetical protein
MKIARCELEGTSSYSQGRYYEVASLPKERPDEKEQRTWRNKMHTDANGNVIIPPMAFKNALTAVAKYLSVQIPGKGKATFTKHFQAGVAVYDPLILPDKAADVEGRWLFVPSDGVRGSGKRVKKCFPEIPKWKGEVVYYVLDDTITKDVFRQHLEESGRFIGIGFFRPQNNGYWGRFKVNSIVWEE